jgi:uncharacterized protein (TIGR03435 family)
MRLATIALFAGMVCSAGYADDPPAFEAASIKPSAPRNGRGRTVRMDGGPGTKDPTRIDFLNSSLASLVTRAYGLNYWQLTGPDWMQTESFDVTAKVPSGATKQQFQTMLQNLLAERFGLEVHRESKQVELYSLTAGKNGPKLKPHVKTSGPEPGDTEPGPLKTGPDGYPVLTHGMTMAWMRDKARLQGSDQDMAWLVRQLAGQLGGPVSDDTGLTGRYDFALYWAAQQGDDGSPDLPEAVQQQLGLKLERKKGPIEMLVVDRVDKTPREN